MKKSKKKLNPYSLFSNYSGDLYDSRNVYKRAFYGMQRRVHIKNFDCDFNNDDEGFEDFLDCMGLIHDSMEWPSVGRIDHDEGYIVGNIQWQEVKDNCSDAGKRQFENLERRKQQSIIGKKTCEKLIEMGIGIHSEEYKKSERKKEVARSNAKLAHERHKDLGYRNAKKTNSIRVECPYGCGHVSTPGGMGNHKKQCILG